MITLQYIIIAVIFIAAVAFIIRKFIPSKSKASGCAKGCGSCGGEIEEKNEGV